MASANGQNYFFNIPTRERSRQGELLGQGIAQLGAGIGQGIAGYRRKQEEKKREDAFVEFVMQHGNKIGLDTSDEKAVRAGVKGLGPQGMMAFSQMEQAMRQQRKQNRRANRQEERLQRATDAGIAIDQQNADTAAMNADTNRMRAEIEAEVTFSNEDIGVAKPVPGAPGFSFVPLSNGHGQLIQTGPQGADVKELQPGDTMDVNGVTWVFDGNSIKPNPGSRETDIMKGLIDIGRVMDGPLGEYYKRTRASDGSIKKGIFSGEVDRNELFEKQIELLGSEIQGFISEESGEKEAPLSIQSIRVVE